MQNNTQNPSVHILLLKEAKYRTHLRKCVEALHSRRICTCNLLSMHCQLKTVSTRVVQKQQQ
jgi:hypothetical protein